ncbi:SGNH/GDSL hydrolase family protein [Membranihabitans maritimus]|uniref:SGNH/GDSL hydrolase family protein n=1 Tax=Membranihabitans maritimus TaxID=2904244 RepID=UPI001F422C60|nr:SGNH/GDSL hydrolase family protein [Membranihabitans maritimus]
MRCSSFLKIYEIYFGLLVFWMVPNFIEGQVSSSVLSTGKWERALIPFWKTDTIYNEIIQPIKDQSSLPVGNLLFQAKEVISVTDGYQKKEFQKGKDWKYKRGKIVIPKGSEIPYFNREDLIYRDKKEGVSMKSSLPDKYILFSENGLLQSRQLAVTYVKKRKSQWKGRIQNIARNQLVQTLLKLKEGKTVKIVFYGDSIETGANSSSTLGQSPFLPTWPELIVYNLRNNYSGAIEYSNKSKGGMKASWGVENADKLVNPENPDLVIIGFGMNDGSVGISPRKFTNQLQSIVNSIKRENPQCEFILITPMIPNPDAIQSGIQKKYRKPIFDLQKKGVAIADLTSVHEELLLHKSYQDMTGNNVNHPNDYLARWYAQVISALLIEK